MDYVLDTSALVSAWNQWYRKDNFPDIWSGIESVPFQSRLVIPDAVFQELSDMDNKLHRWCKRRESVLASVSSVPVQDGVRQIEKDFPQLKNASMPSGKNFADPFVIATAQILGGSVVSHEEAKGPGVVPSKIPDVCREMGIGHYMFHRIVRDENWRFRV